MENSEKDFSYSGRHIGNSLHSLSGSCISELERATEGCAGMDGMAGRGSDNFIRWCHRCKHEIPFYLHADTCELCGGKITIISNESEDKQ